MSVPAPTLAPPRLAAERAADRTLVDGLIARAFGPGRYAKAAERLRETSAPALDLCVVAWSEGVIVGCARLWPVMAGEAPALLLGPFAVDEDWRRRGLGATLILEACDRARAAGNGLIVLVGDAPFFGPLGFEAAPARDLRLPGPVDQARVLAMALRPGAADTLFGMVRAVTA